METRADDPEFVRRAESLRDALLLGGELHTMVDKQAREEARATLGARSTVGYTQEVHDFHVRSQQLGLEHLAQVVAAILVEAGDKRRALESEHGEELKLLRSQVDRQVQQLSSLSKQVGSLERKVSQP